MDKDKNKGLADNQDGEFILNESGTSVTIDPDIEEEQNATEPKEETSEENNERSEVEKDE